jgi:hypothetical protein
MKPHFIYWWVASLSVGTALLSVSCSDKRHDCGWLANCNEGGESSDAAGGTSNTTQTTSTGGIHQSNEGGSSSSASSSSTTGTGSSAVSTQAGGTGGTTNASPGGGAPSEPGIGGATSRTEMFSAGATAGSTEESAGAAGALNVAGAAGSAGSGERPCSGNPNDGDCAIDPSYGVFVSPLGDDEHGAGTPDAPFRTLKAGLVSAKANAVRNVYLCADTSTQYVLPGTLELTAADVGDVSVFGGFACRRSARWIYDPKLQARFVAQVPNAIRFSHIESAVYIENVSITATDATKEGESSIAVMAVQSPHLAFNRVNVEAGKGMRGANGDLYTFAAEEGIAGKDGVVACSTGIGGTAVTKVCEGTSLVSKGGQGGSGIPSLQTNGDRGLPDYLLAFGEAGYGETGKACTVGGDGSRGNDGARGDGGTGQGWLSITNGYIAVPGKTGLTGTPGQGGGGGGGAAPPSIGCPNGAPAYGASGASGGTGGCGGKGGAPGLGGGASIALGLINSPVRITNSTLRAKEGGAGGDGANGQTGGSGKSGGSAKSGVNSRESCAGGRGGQGGEGGRGGGGAGGASVAVAYVGEIPLQSEVTRTVALVAAPGGLGAGNDIANGAGEPGKIAEVLEFQLAPEN